MSSNPRKYRIIYDNLISQFGGINFNEGREFLGAAKDLVATIKGVLDMPVVVTGSAAILFALYYLHDYFVNKDAKMTEYLKFMIEGYKVPSDLDLLALQPTMREQREMNKKPMNIINKEKIGGYRRKQNSANASLSFIDNSQPIIKEFDISLTSKNRDSLLYTSDGIILDNLMSLAHEYETNKEDRIKRGKRDADILKIQIIDSIYPIIDDMKRTLPKRSQVASSSSSSSSLSLSPLKPQSSSSSAFSPLPGNAKPAASSSSMFSLSPSRESDNAKPAASSSSMFSLSPIRKNGKEAASSSSMFSLSPSPIRKNGKEAASSSSMFSLSPSRESDNAKPAASSSSLSPSPIRKNGKEAAAPSSSSSSMFLVSQLFQSDNNQEDNNPSSPNKKPKTSKKLNF
jgi:hypothetical protein